MSKRFEVQSGNMVQDVFTYYGHNNYFRLFDLQIARPSSTCMDYDSTQIDNLIIDMDTHICVIVEAKRREGVSYAFTKWSKQRQAIYIKNHEEPPKQYYWVNPRKRGDIYLEGKKQYREIRRQLQRQKEFLMKSTRNSLPKIFKGGFKEEQFDDMFNIIGEGNFKFILSVSDLRTGLNSNRIGYAVVKDIFVVYHNPDFQRPEGDKEAIRKFIWGF